MSKRAVEVESFTILASSVASLTDEERHFYYLAGFIFNEIGCLRKLISFSICSSGDKRPFRREAEFSQTFFLMRIAGAKVYEAHRKLNGPQIQRVLRADVFPQWPGGVEALRNWNRLVSKARWLANLRNTIGFHYPDLEDWRHVITPTNAWADDVVYFAGEPGNMYFDASEQQVRELMFGPGHGGDPQERMASVVADMVKMTTELGDFIERAQVHFAMSRLIGSQAPKVVGRVLSPALDAIDLPFWTSAAREKGKSRRSMKN